MTQRLVGGRSNLAHVSKRWRTISHRTGYGMGDHHAPQQPFRSVIGDTAEASALLRAHLPPAISRQLRWSTHALQHHARASRDVAFDAAHLTGHSPLYQG